jgi:Tfp pilus assembly protein PilE
MDFACPNCKLAGKIEDAKVPDAGLSAGCPKCHERFLVKREPPPEPSPDLKPALAAPAVAPGPDLRLAGNPGGGIDAAARDLPLPPPPKAPARPAPSHPDADLRLFIGKNADKYLKRFASFRRGTTDGFAATWHWPAFFAPFWWLIYRKQYALAAFAFVLSFIPFVGFVLMPVFGLTANYIYYKYAKKKLQEIRVIPSELSRAVEIARSGGVNNVALVLVPLIAVAILGILAAIAIPQFAAYRMKSFNSSAMTELQKARASVETFRSEHQAYPDDLEQTNYHKVPGIDVHFGDRSADSYTIVATHAKGDREFAAKSDSPGTLFRSNRENDGEFKPVQ